ncbi:MAG TPA: class III extradiol ring-cleavage dioxygenase [Dokdonella sp.]|uniref:DODA-type extradiol aromatic ring-opening family dioxygenase n=1 Tax=Dokdonella sp. TaxID=2291710 RepID=UPI002B794498|nr:class III extradiol ring-cleavage dioxygenase [Dokdonella sp.]HUD42575.1 class III extradiol ring-cleavage dioxygenase [Dokdonella sp.]
MTTTPTLPSLFVSHGSPMLALEDSPAGRFLDGLGTAIGRPRAILIASAHFEHPGPALSAAAQPQTIHDFRGFPPALYALRYPAIGSASLCARAADLLAGAGFAPVRDAARGLDHGAWVPLLRMYRDADVPVVSLSVDPMQDAAWHYRAGRALAPLREEGVLVIGSGGFSHNLRELDWHGGMPADWMTAFTDPLRARLLAGDVDGVLDWRQLPQALRNHPSPEHLLPLFVALGAAGAEPAARLLHASVELGSLALDAFAFEGRAS